MNGKVVLIEYTCTSIKRLCSSSVKLTSDVELQNVCTTAKGNQVWVLALELLPKALHGAWCVSDDRRHSALKAMLVDNPVKERLS